MSPNWDGRNKGVTYMETFGRLMAGVAPWLPLPDDDTEEGQIMGLRHREYDVRGIQFHPESVLTPKGKTIIENWLKR